MAVRLVPRLDVKGPNLVKGIHLEGLRVMGKPEAFARYYYSHGADELIFMDAVASLYGRNHLSAIVSSVARDIFIPLCVGGGLRSVEDIRDVLRAGADKVSLNTHVTKHPELITEAANLFGSSTIVVALEVIRQPNGEYRCFTDGGREETDLDAFGWARRAAELGAGEILITSVNRDGTGKGFDLDLCSKITDAVDIPVIVHGGAGSSEHLVEAALSTSIDALCVASILHYDAIEHLALNESEFPREGNIEFMRAGQKFGNIQPASIADLKAELINAGIDVRPIVRERSPAA